MGSRASPKEPPGRMHHFRKALQPGRRDRRAMGEATSKSSSRKPPEPGADHQVISEWIRGQMPDLQPILIRLDELIREVHPQAQFALKWKKAYYGLPERGWIIELVAYDVSVNAVFLPVRSSPSRHRLVTGTPPGTSNCTASMRLTPTPCVTGSSRPAIRTAGTEADA